MNELNRLASSRNAPIFPATLVVEDRLRQLFRAWAYIETRFDVLQPTGNYTPDELDRTYTVSDTASGAAALRPDFTSLVAREAATIGQAVVRPLRRCYAGSAFRRPQRVDERRYEIRQAGVELIGACGPLADAEILSLASEGLAAIGLETAQIHLGHVGFIRALLRSSDLTDDVERVVCDLLARHDRPALSALLKAQAISSNTANALVRILDLIGNEDVLDQARRLTDEPDALRALAELDAVFDLLERTDLPTPIILDLTEVRDRSYYTGIRFEGFDPASGFPVLRGGRYDDLLGQYGAGEPAVGCAFEVDRIAASCAPKRDESEVLLVRFPPAQWPEAVAKARALRAQNHRVAFDVLSFAPEDLAAYQAAHRVNRVVVLPSGKAQRAEGGC